MNKFTSKSAIVAGLFVAAFAIASTASAYTFSTNLKQGSTGADVQALQVVLNSDAATQVSASGAGAPGSETTYFGAATKAAVIKFQNKFASEVLAPAGLASGTGFVGALTRSKLNTMGGGSATTGMVSGCTSLVGFSSTTGASCASGAVVTTTSTVPGCTSATGFSPTTGASCATGAVTTTTQSGPVTVALAQDNPAASAVVAGSATADLAHFTFTGNGTISNIALQRIGISSNDTLSNVYLYQGNTRVSDGASVNTTGGIIFSGLSIAVNGSVTLSVKADIKTATQGQLVGVQLASFTTTGSTAATTASISGNIMTVASATLADVLLGTQSVASANVDAGTLGYTFWSDSVTVSTRAVSLKGANFKYIGSAPSDALANIKLYVNGTAVGTNGTVNATTQLISFDFSASPVTLNTGISTVEVRADIVKGSNRTVQLSLQNTADLVTMDSQLGVNVSMRTAGTHDAPTFSVTTVTGGTITINVGSVSTNVDTAFNSLTTVTSGSTGVTIGKFSMKAYGEDVKVSTITIEPILAGTTAANTGVNNVALFYNGAQVGSSVANVLTGVDTAFSLGSSMILAAGQTATLEVRADLQGSGAVNYTNGTVSANLLVGASNGQGQNSSSMVNVPTAAVTGNSLTIAAGSLSVAQSAGYSGAQTVNPNTSNVKLASYILSNPSASEGVRVTNLAVALTTSGSLTNLSNLRTTETSGSGSTPINPSAANNFSVNFTLAPGQTKTIDVFADLGAATNTSTYTSTLKPTAVGASSNATLTPTDATNGQTLTVATGSVSAVPTLNPSPASLSAQFVVGGSQNLGVASYNFVATNGAATISELKFLVTGGTIAATSTPVTQVCVGGVCAPVVNNVAHLTGLAISIPAGSGGANVTVQASFSTVGTNGILSNTTAILNLFFMKYTIGGVTTSTLTGTVANLGVSSATPADVVSGTPSTLTMTSTLTPLKVGMVISSIGATTTPISTVGGLGTITAVASATAATVAWATTTTVGASAVIQFFTASSSSLTMVATKPTVTIADSTDSLINGLVKLAEVTIAADAAGALKLVTLPISMTSTGVAKVASGTAAFTVKGTDGTTIASTNGAFIMAAGGTATTTITLGTGYSITAGTSKTFRIYGTASDVSGAVNTTSISTKLGGAELLTWNDVDGGVDNITGTLIYNYPSDTSVITNN